MSSLIIIPTRLENECFSNQPLTQIKLASGVSRSLLLLTYQQAKKTRADYVLVTSPDREIARYCLQNNLTFFPSPKTSTATEQCAEIARTMKRDFDVYVHWDVGEPTIPVGCVDQLIDETNDESIGTLVQDVIGKLGWLYNPHLVKARLSSLDRRRLRVMDLTRSVLPHSAQNLSVYSFTKPTLLRAGKLQTDLSRYERLQALAWLQFGYQVWALWTEGVVSANIIEDVRELESYYETAIHQDR